MMAENEKNGVSRTSETARQKTLKLKADA